MSAFYISVKKDGQIFRDLEKVEIGLDTTSNIAAQAKDLVSSILASMNMIYSENEYSWKVYRHKMSKYWLVSKSNNWVGE